MIRRRATAIVSGVTSTRNSNGTAGIAAKKSGVLADRSPSGRQRSDFMSFQTSILSAPTASRAVEATNGPAVQSQTWTPLHRAGRFFDFAGTENRSAASSENFQNQKRASLQAWAKSTTR